MQFADSKGEIPVNKETNGRIYNLTGESHLDKRKYEV